MTRPLAATPAAHTTFDDLGRACAVLPSPFGPLAVIAAGGALVAGGFTDDPAVLWARLPGRPGADPDGPVPGDPTATLAAAAEAWQRYLDGDLAALADLPVHQSGTPLRQAVWQVLRGVAPGQTASYAALAVRAGYPGAARAAGSACGANLVAPFVPCHRAVRSDGSPGGYHYGLHVKRALLEHEQRHRDG